MAISFTPEKESKFRFKFRPDKIFWTLVAVVGFLILVFGGLKIYETSLSGQLSSIESQIEEVDKKRDTELESEIRKKAQLASQTRPLLEKHVRAKKVFELLQNNIYSGVRVKNFEFKVESRTASMNANAVSPIAVAMQVASFDPVDQVKSIGVSSLSIGKEGVNFRLKIKLKPELFRY